MHPAALSGTTLQRTAPPGTRQASPEWPHLSKIATSAGNPSRMAVAV
jgi:hypothetical protein